MTPLALALALVAAAPAPAPAPVAAAAPARPKLLVLDFRDDGVGPQAVRIVHDTLAAHLSRDPRIEVIPSEDVRRLADLEAEKLAVGCTDEGCLAEIAGALGAQLLLHGTAGKLGELVVVNVSLYDAPRAQSIGRETIEAQRLEDLPSLLRAAGDRLLRTIVLPPAPISSGGTAPTSTPPVPSARSMGFAPLFWTGVAVAGIGTGCAVVFGALSFGSARDVRDAETFDDKSLAKGAEEDFGMAALVGAGAAAIGAVAAAASFALE